MRETFATPGEIGDAFTASVLTGAVVIGLMTVIALALLRDQHRTGYAKWVIALALAGFLGVLYVSYASSFGHFIAIEASGSGLELRYVGPRTQNVLIPRSSVDTILFGTPGKLSQPCYVRVISKSGETYRSASLKVDLNTCKQLRSRLLAALGT